MPRPGFVDLDVGRDRQGRRQEFGLLLVIAVLPLGEDAAEFAGGDIDAQLVQLLQEQRLGDVLVVVLVEDETDQVRSVVAAGHDIGGERGDQASALPKWHEAEEVLKLATVSVVHRAGYHREEVAVQVASLKGAAGVRFFDMPRIDVSSSQVRHRVADGKPIRYLVPDKVIGYIEANGLYTASTPATAA